MQGKDIMSKKNINPMGSSWDELEKQLFTPQEIEETNARISIVNEIIKSRENNERITPRH